MQLIYIQNISRENNAFRCFPQIYEGALSVVQAIGQHITNGIITLMLLIVSL